MASLVVFVGVGDISVSPSVSVASVPEAPAQEETPTPLPEPPLPPEPPPAFVYIAGIAHRATVGTYCWFPFGCVDAIGVITPREPVWVTTPTTARIAFADDLGISSAELIHGPVRMTEGEEITVGRWRGLLAWRRFVGIPKRVQLRPVQNQEVTLSLSPGPTVLAVTVYFRRGDASYGLLLDAGSSHQLYAPYIIAAQQSPVLASSAGVRAARVPASSGWRGVLPSSEHR